MFCRKVFADEEAIETKTRCLPAGGNPGRKVFADEEAIETGVAGWALRLMVEAGKYSLMKKRLRLQHASDDLGMVE